MDDKTKLKVDMLNRKLLITVYNIFQYFEDKKREILIGKTSDEVQVVKINTKRSGDIDTKSLGEMFK